MTALRPGMAVHLVKMASYSAELRRNGIAVGDVGIILGASDPLGHDEPLWKVRFDRHGHGPIFWLARENIEPTSPNGVTIERPAMRENGLYWIGSPGDWTVAEWLNGNWITLGGDVWMDADHFDDNEIGPRLTPPEEG